MNQPDKIRLVCATRETREDFFRKAALGRSTAARAKSLAKRGE